jgi:23S rRNA pseudouridine1911/1915/1917 synthase
MRRRTAPRQAGVRQRPTRGFEPKRRHFEQEQLEARRESRLVRRVGVREVGRRLVDVLRDWLAERLSDDVPMARVRALLASGGVRVDGAVVRSAGRPLRRGEHVEAQLDAERLRSRALALDRPFELTAARILFDDGVVLAVDKPPGLPTHATADPSRPSLVSHVEGWLAARGVTAPVSVHQRLDRDTSGVVLFGVDPRANAGLARGFAEHLVLKRYLALAAAVREPPAPRFRISAPIAPATADRPAVRIGGPEAVPAETDVLVREALSGALLVEARPRTGRRHQVRVHLAHAGFPILGDPVYGRPTPGISRLMLHAWRLELPHPVTGEPLAIEAPIPADFAAAVSERRRA